MKDSRRRKIYRLADPRYSPEDANYIRYVGKTKKRLRDRLSPHLTGRKWHKSARDPWFGELADEGLKPEIQLVEIVQPGDSLSSREHYWVEYHEKIGYNLLNVTLMGGVTITEDIGDLIEARRCLAKRVKEATREAKDYSRYVLWLKRKGICYGREGIY